MTLSPDCSFSHDGPAYNDGLVEVTAKVGQVWSMSGYVDDFQPRPLGYGAELA